MYVCTDTPWDDWIESINKVHPKVRYIKELVDMTQQVINIVPISEDQYVRFKDEPNSVFKNTEQQINTFRNKCEFAKYMMKNHPEHHAKTYFYSLPTDVFISTDLSAAKRNNLKFIVKKAIGSASFGVAITYKPNLQDRNTVLTEYVEHTSHCVGHFLVLGGKIVEKVYFWCDEAPVGGIKRGRIRNYRAEETSKVDDSIFAVLFKEMNYSGFSCADFIVKNNKIIIFEVNPRPGGSLIHDVHYFNKFVTKLININENNNTLCHLE